MPLEPLRVMILAGGRGERFWPLSREHRPKPFLDLGEGKSLLQETFFRAMQVARPENIRVVAGRNHSTLVRHQLRGLGAGGLLVEPAARNTGPAALLASRRVWGESPRAEVLVLPSDHRIRGLDEFRRAVQRARTLARRGFLVTFGIRPGGPDPSFGYIVPGESLGRWGRRVMRFVEKPNRRRAKALLERNSALWNSGMFLWRADLFLGEASRCVPSFAKWLRQAGERAGVSRIARESFPRLPSVPVDRAVLERSERVAVVPVRFKWSDLGTWSALYDMLPHDRRGNASWGILEAIGARENLVVNSGGMTVLLGLNNLLVVRSGDILLVSPRHHASRMKTLLQKLRKAGHGRYL